MNKIILCSCGFPQSHPIPHEHDQTNREKEIITYYKNQTELLKTLNKELYEALKQWNKYLETPYPKNLIVKKHAYNLTEIALAHYEGKEK